MKCERCGDEYPDEEMPWGLCEDCFDVLSSKDLEEQLEDIGIL